MHNPTWKPLIIFAEWSWVTFKINIQLCYTSQIIIKTADLDVTKKHLKTNKQKQNENKYNNYNL